MRTSFFLKAFLISGTVLATSPAFAGESVESIITEGEVFGHIRYRYETVEQGGIANDAEASTVRTNVGFKTGAYKDFQGLIEAQLVNTIGANDFNDTVNGKTAYPVVADPETAEINQAWVSWSGLPDTVIKAGRQVINLDNQRFVGDVGWRQNDQTYDSVLVANSSIPDLAVAYAHAWNVNRINGGDHPAGDLETETHVAHASYKVADWLTATGYGYWIDIGAAPSVSSKTYGVRLTGDVPLNDNWSLFYEAEAATQSDHGSNTASYDEEYYHISPGIKGHGWTLQAGYEELGGDGTNAFTTPLATLHKFNGWADKFLTTPAAGLEDAYAQISYKFANVHEWLDGTTLTAVYHSFEGNDSGDFGDEIDLSIGKSFKLPEGLPAKDIHVLLKYADYNAEDAPYTDTEKFWLQFTLKF